MICLAGLPGTGKSSVSRALAARIGALWLRVDAVEQALRDSHMVVQDDLADGGYAALRAVAGAALEQGFHVVTDSVNPLPATRDGWRDVAERAGAMHWDVELVCSDPALHRQRVETREAEVPGLVLPDWAAVNARAYVPMAAPDLRLDMARLGLPQAVKRVVDMIEEREG